MFLDGNELTQSCSLVCLFGFFTFFFFFFFSQLLTSWRACTEHGYKKKNKRLSYRSRHSQLVFSCPHSQQQIDTLD